MLSKPFTFVVLSRRSPCYAMEHLTKWPTGGRDSKLILALSEPPFGLKWGRGGETRVGGGGGGGLGWGWGGGGIEKWWGGVCAEGGVGEGGRERGLESGKFATQCTIEYYVNGN